LKFSLGDAKNSACRSPETWSLPLRQLRNALFVLVAAGMLASGTGGAAGATPRETPSHKIARLRDQALHVQRTIDRMNAQVERLVEDYNANREALEATRAQERATERRRQAAERQLQAAQQVLDQRVRAIYVNGPVSSLAQLLGAVDVHDALTQAKYQAGVVDADSEAIARVDEARRLLETVAADLARQRRAQEELQRHLERQRQEIEARLAGQRRYLARVKDAVKRAVEAERRRQEELRRRALARRLAAARAAARARAARAVVRDGRRPSSGWAAQPGLGRHSSGTAREAMRWALAQLGKPYQWGATGPGSFDCSGLTMSAYAHAGLSLPRTAASQWYAGPHVGLGDLAPGDLLFFADNTADPSTIHHVGMYVGNGQMVEAPYTGASVRISSIGRGDYVGAVRPSG
jgi:cell wall-associated NlpC family hydrolase